MFRRLFRKNTLAAASEPRLVWFPFMDDSLRWIILAPFAETFSIVFALGVSLLEQLIDQFLNPVAEVIVVEAGIGQALFEKRGADLFF